MLRTTDTASQSIATSKVIAGNRFSNMNEVKAVFTVDNVAETLAIVPGVYAMVGAGNVAARTLPSGVTYSGDFSTYADFLDYLQSNRMLVVGIRLETSDSANYTGQKLTLGTRMPNNRNNPERDLNLADYKTSTGSAIDTTLNIPADKLDNGFSTGPDAYAKFSGLKKNTSVSVYFIISHKVQAVEMQPINF